MALARLFSVALRIRTCGRTSSATLSPRTSSSLLLMWCSPYDSAAMSCCLNVLPPFRRPCDRKAHARVSRLFFRVLIDDAWGDEVRFSVPEHLSDLRKLA